MKNFFIIPFIFLLFNCTQTKSVLICGDHVCINKAEAKQYFEENLSIEVKIIDKDKNKKNKIDLVELNLNENSPGKRKISISKKNKTNENLKTLSDKEITEIKEKIKSKKKEKKIAKKNFNNNDIIKKDISNKNRENQLKRKSKKIVHNVNKRDKDIVDVCTIIKKCSIDEISKYLLKQGKKKDFPDITLRQ